MLLNLEYRAESYNWSATVAIRCTKSIVNDISDLAAQGRTALIEAARRGHEGIVRLLLERGARVNTQDAGRRAPLIFLSQWAPDDVHDILTALLLQNGKTALWWARRSNDVGTMDALMEAGATGRV